MKSRNGLTTCGIVVHYGDRDETYRFLQDVLDHFDEIAVVANDLSERPNALPKKVKWHIPPQNLGFGGAVMWVHPKTDAEILVILNTDVEIGRDTAVSCIEVFRDESVGIVAPTLWKAGRVQSGAGELSRFMKRPLQRQRETRPELHPAVWVTGAVMFIRGEVLRQVGFREGYFLIHEDVDICVAARSRGWKVLCSPAVARHHQEEGHSLSSTMAEYYTVRNQIWFTRTNFGPLAVSLSAAHGGYLVARAMVGCVVRRGGRALVRLRMAGLWDGLRIREIPEYPLDEEPVPQRYIQWGVQSQVDTDVHGPNGVAS